MPRCQQVLPFGWGDGRNVRIDTRWGENDVDCERSYAAELVALASDVILAAGTPSVDVRHRGKAPLSRFYLLRNAI